MNNTQLSDFHTYNTSNILFSKCEVGNIPNQKLTFKRIRIGTRNPDGTTGDLIISTPANLLSFGLQETRDLVTNQINGYVFPLCLWGQHGCRPEEKQFSDLFTNITDVCKDYLLSHREEIEKYDLDASDLKKLNPLFWKTEKGRVVEGRGPMLYIKVMYNKRNEAISTIFVDESSNEEIDPFRLLNKRCHTTAAIKFESIFIGTKISLQVKLYEAVVNIVESNIRHLLRPNAIRRPALPQDTTEDEDGDNVVNNTASSVSVPPPVPTTTASSHTLPSVAQLIDQYGEDDDDEDEDEDENDTTPSVTTAVPTPTVPVTPPTNVLPPLPNVEVEKKKRGGVGARGSSSRTKA